MPIDPFPEARLSPGAMAAQDQAYMQAMDDLKAWKAPPPRFGQALAPYQGGMAATGAAPPPMYGARGLPPGPGAPFGRPVTGSGPFTMPARPGLPAGRVMDAFGTPVGRGPLSIGAGPASPGASAVGRAAASIPFVPENQIGNQMGAAARGPKMAGWKPSALPGVLGKAGKVGAASRVGAGLGLTYGGAKLGEALGGNTSAAGRFASGAGTGAGFGLMFGPYGAAVGGAVGGGLNVLLGGKQGKKADPVANLSSAMSQAGFAPQQSQQLLTYYNVIAQLGGNTKESKKAAYDAVVPLFTQILTQQLGIGEGGAGGGGQVPNPADYAALQASTAKFIEPYHRSALVNAQAQSNYLRSNAQSLPPAYRSVMQAGAMSGQVASVNLANAYAAQSQLAPQAAAIQTGIQQYQSLGAQLQNNALQSAMGGGNAAANDPFAAAGL